MLQADLSIDELRAELTHAIYFKRMLLEAKYPVNIFIEDGHLICRGSISTNCTVQEFFSPECVQKFEDFIAGIEKEFEITVSKNENTLDIYKDSEEPILRYIV